MSRSVLGEESVIGPYVDALLARRADAEARRPSGCAPPRRGRPQEGVRRAQTGLLIGKQAVGSRDLILALVRTPSADGSDAAPTPVAAVAASKKAGGAAAKKPAAEASETHLRPPCRLVNPGARREGTASRPGGAAHRRGVDRRARPPAGPHAARWLGGTRPVRLLLRRRLQSRAAGPRPRRRAAARLRRAAQRPAHSAAVPARSGHPPCPARLFARLR